MQSTDFGQLFDKLLQIVATSLTKANLILEDKIIIQNAVSMMIGIAMSDPVHYTKLINFQAAAGSPIANSE